MNMLKTIAFLLASPVIFLVSILTMFSIIVLAMVANLFSGKKAKVIHPNRQPFEEWEADRTFIQLAEGIGCGYCTPWMRGSFPSEQAFLELDSAMKQGSFEFRQTIPGGSTKSKYEFLGVGIGARTFFGADVYFCSRCRQEWELSS